MKFKYLVGLLCVVGVVGAFSVTTQGCGGSSSVDGGFVLTSGTYTASAASNINDGCMTDPNNAAAPLAGSTFVFNFEPDGGMAELFGSSGQPTGTPPQPAQGSGMLMHGEGTLSRDNTVNLTDNAGATICTFELKIQNVITASSDSSFSAAYTRTEGTHTGTACPTPGHADNCTTTFDWSLTK
jgi:hypothetical protein